MSCGLGMMHSPRFSGSGEVHKAPDLSYLPREGELKRFSEVVDVLSKCNNIQVVVVGNTVTLFGGDTTKSVDRFGRDTTKIAEITFDKTGDNLSPSTKLIGSLKTGNCGTSGHISLGELGEFSKSAMEAFTKLISQMPTLPTTEDSTRRYDGQLNPLPGQNTRATGIRLALLAT